MTRGLHFDSILATRRATSAALRAGLGAALLALACAATACGDDDGAPPPVDAGADTGVADAATDLGPPRDAGDAGESDADTPDAGDPDAGGDTDGGPGGADAGGADAGGDTDGGPGGTDAGGDSDAGGASDAGGTPDAAAMGDASAPPTGETCEEAFDATAGGVFMGDTRRPVRNDYDATGPGCPRGVGGGDLVYRLSPTSTLRYRVRVEPMSPTWDPSLYVLSNCVTQVCLAGTVLNGRGEPEQLEVTVTGGTTVFVVVDGEVVSSGPYTLTITPLL